MDKENLNDIIKEIEILLQTLKSEIYSGVNSVSRQENFDDPTENYIVDYDELFDSENEYLD